VWSFCTRVLIANAPLLKETHAAITKDQGVDASTLYLEDNEATDWLRLGK
jgi:hypothetical protein